MGVSDLQRCECVLLVLDIGCIHAEEEYLSSEDRSE